MLSATDKIIENANCNANFESDPILCDKILLFSAIAKFTGAPNGAMEIQVSNDKTNKGDEVVNWFTLPSSSQAVAAAGNKFFEQNDFKYKWFKLVYTFTSGTGACDVFYNGKGA